MRTYQHTAFIVLDRYDVLHAGHESDASVGSGRRRRFLDLCGFRFSTTLWNVFLIDLRDSVVFSVVKTFMEFERIGNICFVFDFILHTAYTVHAWALTSILPSLSLIDMMCWTADKKATPASVEGVDVDFEIDMDIASPQRCETCS
jgi:hypothetical protein